MSLSMLSTFWLTACIFKQENQNQRNLVLLVVVNKPVIEICHGSFRNMRLTYRVSVYQQLTKN
jgi:hypothetical protein